MIFGMEPDMPVPDGWEVVGAVAVLRCIDAGGQRRMLPVYAGDVMAWEALGMINVAEIDVRKHLDAAPHLNPIDDERSYDWWYGIRPRAT